ncbi:MAG: hypothetical protein JWR40_646 [Massilia sp.]|nr:hypothetical protein [Massilia sp.]
MKITIFAARLLGSLVSISDRGVLYSLSQSGAMAAINRL